MKKIKSTFNLPNEIIYIIESFLVYKHEFDEVIDEIDSGKHIIRYNSIYSFDDRYDVYIPKIDNYIEIKLSCVYNERPNLILSNSKPLYLCRECKKNKEVKLNEIVDECVKFQCHLLHLYENKSNHFWIG